MDLKKRWTLFNLRRRKLRGLRAKIYDLEEKMYKMSRTHAELLLRLAAINYNIDSYNENRMWYHFEFKYIQIKNSKLSGTILPDQTYRPTTFL